MKFTKELNRQSLEEIYTEKKAYIVPVATILVSILLFIFFILPQIIQFPSKKSVIDRENEKIGAIRNAINVVKNADIQKLDSDLAQVNQTFPQGKEFEKVLNAISAAAGFSNSFILSYEFQDSATTVGTKISDIPALNFKVTIFGGPVEAAAFIEELYKLNPISEAVNIKTDEGSTELSILFFYRPIETISEDQSAEIKNLSPEQGKTLSLISNWRNFDIPPIPQNESSVSAGTRTSPF